MKIQQVLSSLSLNSVGIYSRDEPFSNDLGFVNLPPSKGTHCVCSINANYFDSYGYVHPQKLSKFIINEMDIVYILNKKFTV